MKIHFTISAIVVLLVSQIAWGQDFQGIATYKSKRQIEVSLDSTQMNSEMHQRMIEMMKKQFEKTHILTFDKTKSTYKEEESLSPPTPSGMEIMIVSSDGADVLYKDIQHSTYTNQNEVFGKIFLIKDSIPKIEWELHKDTKNIGEYTCFKATATREVEVSGKSGISVNGDKDLDDETVKKETITITAWYTPQIPISNGPARYQGLPGLILEANDGTQTIICSKIVFNPEENLKIEEPSKGKEVNQEEFDEIMRKKTEEMKERFSSDRKDGNTIEIKIRG